MPLLFQNEPAMSCSPTFRSVPCFVCACLLGLCCGLCVWLALGTLPFPVDLHQAIVCFRRAQAAKFLKHMAVNGFHM